MKESIERALRAAYPGRVDPEWFDQMSEPLRPRGEPAPPSAASATGPAELEVTEIDPRLGTGEGASHPAVQPVATVTSPEASSPPAGPLAGFVPAPITGPVSNLDFPPVDDAFALEMRSETIEQLAGGDALRRGESERIEAGRSQTNADLVAGRDRVRVQGTLREHTGHGLAEQAAHLHTTVDGRLDVHAASEDTVLLAGHMRELWDGGAAIVAAMTDDTVAGGGIRVTTPLDLWVHGLMGVEERIGTCTADAVLLELGATHYEREYGPGAHAAGLAVYTGSLYQSNRSTFRPLIRVSSGVRNLIAGGGGRGAGGDAGAGGAPPASPSPVPAETGAAVESVTGTFAAGRRAAEAPATALDAADELTGARRVPLEALVDSVHARVAEETGEAAIVMRAEDLPELSRCADTAEQLGALKETLRIDGAASGSAVAGGFRASEIQVAGSMHPAGGGCGPLEIEPPSAVHGENAPMVRPHPDVPWGQGQKMKLGLLGGADRPPRPAAPKSDFHAIYRRLRELGIRYNRLSRTDVSYALRTATQRIRHHAVREFKRFGGDTEALAHRPSGISTADHAYRALQETARQADRVGDPVRSGAIRDALDAITKRAVERLEAVCRKYGISATPPTWVMPPRRARVDPTVAVAPIPPPAHAPIQFDWILTYRQLRDLAGHFLYIGWDIARLNFRDATASLSNSVMHRFRKFGGDPAHLLPLPSGVTKPEQAYRALEDMYRRAAESGDAARAYLIRQALTAADQSMTVELEELTRKYGALDALSAQATGTEPAVQLPPARVGPKTSAAVPVAFMAPVTGGAAQAPVSAPDPGSAGNLAQVPGAPGQPLSSSLPGPSLCEAGGAEVGSLGHWRLDPPPTTPGATAAHPVAAGAIVAPSLAETSSFWLQPADPAPGSVPFDSGLHHAGETVRPPPAITTASSAAPAPGAAFPVPAWADDDFAVERALLAGLLPPRFDASRLIVEAGMFIEFGLAGELAAGRLPGQTIDALIEGYRATNEGGRNALYIEYLHAMKESIERALRAAYRGRVDPQWLDHVREVLGWRGEPDPPSAASATGLAALEVAEIDRLLGTGEGVSHPAPLPPPSAAGRTGAGAGAPPPAADPWRIRLPGMRGGPHPIASDPWSAPPGPGSRIVHTEAIRTPLMPTGAPPGRQRAETTGFVRAASGVVELPFSRREAIALRFSTEDALREAEHALRTVDDDVFGWSATRWPEVFADLLRLNATVRSDSAAAAASVDVDVDWSAIETLVRILDVPPPLP